MSITAYAELTPSSEHKCLPCCHLDETVLLNLQVCGFLVCAAFSIVEIVYIITCMKTVKGGANKHLRRDIISQINIALYTYMYLI